MTVQIQHRKSAQSRRKIRLALMLVAAATAILHSGPDARGGDKPALATPAMFKQYCFQCHGKAAMGGLNLEQLAGHSSIGEGFRQWQKVALVLEQKRMPPPKTPHPTEAETHQALMWVRGELDAYAKKHDGEPGNVTVRRLTSGEYGYAIQDLTGLSLDWGIDATSDSAGGEGFTNYGDVQFMQESNVERYLDAAKRIANHAVIGAGPLQFFTDPGTTGLELSAITRIRDIYAKHGFRTVSGEGGIPYGLDKYGKAFYTAWRFQHRAALGQPTADIKKIAAQEGVSAQFAQHIWNVVNRPSLGYPASEVAARWKKLPAPGPDAKATTVKARAQCEMIEKYVATWPSWLFARGDLAAGGAGDESPLVINDAALKVAGTHHFVFNSFRFARNRSTPVTGPAKIFISVTPVTQNPIGKPVVVWKNPTIAFRRGGFGRPPSTPATPATADATATGAGNGALRRFAPAGPKEPLRSLLNEENARKLNFGTSPDGTEIGPNDFASGSSLSFELPVPEGVAAVVFEVDAQLGKDRDQVFRVLFSDREDGSVRGIPTRALIGDPESAGYRQFKSGVLELAAIMPPNSQVEPTPADKDPAPQPFDSKYNTPEHDEFVLKVKYVRDDRFIYNHMLDDATRRQLDHAWTDLYSSFDYHDNYVRMLGQHYSLNLNKRAAEITPADLEAIPADARKYIAPLVTEYEQVQDAQSSARRGHVEDCLKFAVRAWRRPLTEKEKQSLRAFYDKSVTTENDHRKAIRALLTRILVSPTFLYRVEQIAGVAPIKPLAGTELASRLSFFLWSSIPDEELLRASTAGELATTQGLQRQAKRMLADPRARRLSTEFFGQWLGFYHFDQHRGVDTGRFPEFTDEVRLAMYDEAISFFEHIVRNPKPVRDLLFADYTFLNAPLAKHYGVKKELPASGKVTFVDGANAFQRGGMLRLGALLTATSAPLRTSPVKRGDWLLRRVLGTPVPPPPADAGSIPADDKLFGGLSLHEKLEQHKRNPTCANCHVRIDPLGFPLERYDSIGRVREKYADGKPVYDSGTLSDKTEVNGVEGLLRYLQSQEKQVIRTLAFKLVGYALGRTVQPADEVLIQRMAAAGGNATFAHLVSEIVGSRQFRNHTGKDEQLALQR
ncbi:MAG: DUF1592 domain-containing protein [Acidobacteria bacterium]|nr:DUF1592 domain-containing protein [Acidobacteriota bacterium]